MSFFYFFENDGECKWMRKQIKDIYPKYLHEPIDYDGKKVKFYVILNWITRKTKGANLEWLNELKINHVNNLEDLPDDAGIFVTGYDADLIELQEARNKNIPIIDYSCPWIKKLKEQLLEVNHNTHQAVLMIIKGHMVYDCYKSAFPDDIIIILPDDYGDEIKKYKNDKPIHLLIYAAFRTKDVDKLINFINTNYSHPENLLDGYKKTLCTWTKQGLFEEIETAVTEYELDEIWIICSSDGDTSTRSILREVKESGAKPKIIKNEEDIPKNIDNNLKIGVLDAAIPLSKRVKNFKAIIKKRFDNMDNGS